MNNSNPGISAIASGSKPKDPPPGCKGMPGPPYGPKKSKKRCDDSGKGNDFNHCD